jgi:hypothetical protein
MIPKSLHTVTALVNVAVLIRTGHAQGWRYTRAEALALAAQALGYRGADDPHGLVAKALAAWDKSEPPQVVACADGGRVEIATALDRRMTPAVARPSAECLADVTRALA